ncbi:MAG: acyltransferase [Gemmatimonadaceae bacterium]
MPALDALRAIAVLLVICSHYTTEFWEKNLGGVPPSRYASLPFFNWGWSGVDLFFILSGYLIGRQLWKERLSTGNVRFGAFVLRRGFRIWPLYFAMLLYFAIAGPIAPNWKDAAFLSNYLSGGMSRGWSLSTEEQFYILVPLLLIATRMIRRPLHYLWLLAGALVMVWLARWNALHWYVAHGYEGRRLSDAMYPQFHLHSEALIVGLVIALASVWRPARFERDSRAGFSTAGFAIFIGGSAVGLLLRTLDRNIFAFTGLAFIYGSLALWLLWDRSWVSRLASLRAFYPISRLSYGMYLNHFYIFPFVTIWLITTLRSHGMSEPVWFSAGLLSGVAISAGVAMITFLLIERPFLALRDRLLPARHSSRDRAAATPDVAHSA